HLVNGTGRDEVTRLEDGEPVTVRRGQVEVVQRRDDRHPESPDGAHQLQLVPEVEMVRGFVEQEYRRVLRERAGELNTLTLPGRERLPASPGPVPPVRRAHRVVDPRARGAASTVAAAGYPAA